MQEPSGAGNPASSPGRAPAPHPVERIPTDPKVDHPQPGEALCLSGGGYRAMLFHLGALCRLNEAGRLPALKRVSSVSGGSITAGVLGLAWRRLRFGDGGVAQNFDDLVVVPLRRLAGRTIDIPAALHNLLSGGAAKNHIAGSYRKYVFGDATLQDLPADDEGPRFVINGANLQSGALWRFSRPYMADYRVGRINQPTLDLATAVAVSSAAPPFLSPVILNFPESAYLPGSGLDLQQAPFTTRVFLTDGGVYDNLGLETAWKNYTSILVSDGGGHAGAAARQGRDVARHMVRVVAVIDNQVRSLRKRELIESFQLPATDSEHRAGAYWGIRSDIANFGLPDALPCPVERTTRLADMPTRLAALPAVQQERLMNWGYAVCDAALRRWVDPKLPCPQSFLYPRAGIG